VGGLFFIFSLSVYIYFISTPKNKESFNTGLPRPSKRKVRPSGVSQYMSTTIMGVGREGKEGGAPS